MEIGEKIKYYRNLNNLTQRELAEQSKISEISIKKYESGDRFPKQEQIDKLALVLGDEFLNKKQDSTCLASRTQTDDIIYIPPNTDFITAWREQGLFTEHYHLEIIYPFIYNGYEMLTNYRILFDNSCINGHLLSLIKRIKYKHTDDDLVILNKQVRRLMNEKVANAICIPQDNDIIDIERIYFDVLKEIEEIKKERELQKICL